MGVKEVYNLWAKQYDSNENKTRDLEGTSLRETLSDIHFTRCLEIGCGTGKNTAWLTEKSQQLTAVDFSDRMLAIAKSKIQDERVIFVQADIRAAWKFAVSEYDLVTFSLILEHIENLNEIFEKVSKVLQPGGHVYIGELHPFKQYTGTKARFETETGLQEVPCFNHHLSDFFQATKKYGLHIVLINEYFDGKERSHVPRILTILLKKEV